MLFIYLELYCTMYGLIYITVNYMHAYTVKCTVHTGRPT